MKNVKDFLYGAPFILVVLLVYRGWFSHQEIIGGDWPYFFDETIRSLSFFPPAWSTSLGGGLGGPIVNYFLTSYLHFTAFFSTHIVDMSWVIAYKIFWFGLFLLLSFFSGVYFSGVFFPQLQKTYRLLSGVIYTTNTYILTIVGGGQMGIALSYGLSPYVLAMFSELIRFDEEKGSPIIQKSRVKKALLTGCVLALQILFDPRIAYLTLGIAVLYFVLLNKNILLYKRTSILRIFIIALPILAAFFLNAYWIVPQIFVRSSVPAGLLSIEGFRFLSFSDFSHAFAFLHPTWPENIFGKAHFLQPEFLLLPLLAFSSLLFVSKKNPTQGVHVVFFVLVGLIGAFLTKGNKEPFGLLNEWFFSSVPWMNTFRDPTKYLIFVAIAFSALIPVSLDSLSVFLGRAEKHLRLKVVFPYLFLILWIFLHKESVLGNLGGTFAVHEIPTEFVLLKNMLVEDKTFSRVLWVPKQQRFGFNSQTHLAVEARELLQATSSSSLLQQLDQNNVREYLSHISVGYVIIPDDPLGEIFLDDRKYSQPMRDQTEKALDKMSWMKKIQSGKITVYKVPAFKDRFWIEGEGSISYQMLDDTKYILSIKTALPSSLHFSENYSSYWQAIGTSFTIGSMKDIYNLNTFAVPAGTYTFVVYYSADKYFFIGKVISFLAVVVLLLTFVILSKKRYAE